MTGEHGSVSPMALAVGGLAMMLAMAVAAVGQLSAARVRVTTAAEAAALAAAPATFRPFGDGASPRSAAAAAAAANGATLTSCDCPLDSTYAARTVVVEASLTTSLLMLGRSTVGASAAAEFIPLELLSG